MEIVINTASTSTLFACDLLDSLREDYDVEKLHDSGPTRVYDVRPDEVSSDAE